jgi:hypothetical protein
MTIDELYRFVQFIANKDQRGFVKPSEFNLAATRAQLDIIEEKFKEKNSHKNLDDLAPVTEKATITYSAGTNGAFTYPSNFLHFVSMTFNGKSVEIIGHEKLQNVLGSQILAPNADNPVAVMIDEGFEIYDGASEANAGVCVLTYIKEPSAPKWTYTSINGISVYNASAADAQELTLPVSTNKDIIHKILEYIGVSLREEDLVQFGTSFSLSSKEE